MTTNTFIIDSAYAQLSGCGLLASHRYLNYAHARYFHIQTNDGWWHRKLVLTENHWLCLSGSLDTPPSEAFWSIVSQSARPHLPLPVLLTALFLSMVADPDALDQRALYQEVALAVADLLPLIQASQSTADKPGSPDVGERSSLVVNGILQNASPILWPRRESDQLELLSGVVNHLWRFPPDLVRHLVLTTLDFYDTTQESFHDEKDGSDASTSFLTPLGILRRVSALRWWYDLHFTFRDLPIHAELRYAPYIWEQLLLLKHPDAPVISDATFTWLCGGSIGNPYEAPLTEFLTIDQLLTELPISLTCYLAHIKKLSEESTSGIYTSVGQWEYIVDAQLPILQALHIHSMRIVATPQGCWVRLITDPTSWGRVLWWLPEVEPPPSLAFILAAPRTSPEVRIVHTTLWEFWRDLRVLGHPVKQ